MVEDEILERLNKRKLKNLRNKYVELLRQSDKNAKYLVDYNECEELQTIISKIDMLLESKR